MAANKVHVPSGLLLRPLCNAYHGCDGLYYAHDDQDNVHPECVTCRNCLRIMVASHA